MRVERNFFTDLRLIDAAHIAIVRMKTHQGMDLRNRGKGRLKRLLQGIRWQVVADADLD